VKESLIEQLKSVGEFFERSTRCLTEEDSSFVPVEGMFSVAQQVDHAAQTIEWFVEGALSPTGFDLDFEKHLRETMACSSLTAARRRFDEAVRQAIARVGACEDADLLLPLPEGPILAGAPKSAAIGAIPEHTAHHRGALSVYSRLLGKTPLMPYGE